MNLLRKAGKTFEKTKQAFIEGKDAPYVCRECEEAVSEASEYCPHCGEDAVVPAE